MKIAVITGASSGLGSEFVRQLANDQEIESFWVIARRRERLQALQEYTAKPVRPIPMDLTDETAMEEFRALLASQQPEIRMLVCAAGMGKIGDTVEISSQDNDRMIDLNCRGAVDVTTACFPYLSRGSRIIEISSATAFSPMPGMNVYAASKAFLQSYTKTLHHEFLTKGIHVTCVCPYWIKDTEFIGTARKTSQKYYSHYPLASVSSSVVKQSLIASSMNLWVCTPGIVCTLDRFFGKYIPHFIYVPIMDLLKRL